MPALPEILFLAPTTGRERAGHSPCPFPSVMRGLEAYNPFSQQPAAFDNFPFG